MKKHIISLFLLGVCAVANAQQSKYSVPEDPEERKYGLFDRKKVKQREAEADAAAANRNIFGDAKGAKKASAKSSKPAIDEKYLVGACPEVNGKVQWETVIEKPGMSASVIYERLLKGLMLFVKESEHTQYSKVSVVNQEDKQIGVRAQEWLTFVRKPLCLDQTKFNYQLIINCFDGKCHVTMRNISYVYEEERGGGQFPAEDMISDAEALNKTKDGFQKGGCKKFRTKTIDRKDAIFARLADMLK